MTTSRRLPSQKVELTKRVLFEIEEHHNECLRIIVRQHYKRLPNGQHDKFWVSRLTPPLKKQLRLHLCVFMRGDCFDWTDREIGTRIIFICRDWL